MDDNLFTTTLMDMVNVAVATNTPIDAEDMATMISIARSVAAGTLNLG